jgi:rubrerythrin
MPPIKKKKTVKRLLKQGDRAASALAKAVASEKLGIESYLRFARQTANTSGKDMFIRLAQDEFEHMNALEKELDRLQDGKPCVRINIRHSDIEEIVPQLDSPMAKIQAGQGTADDLSALNIALELERRAVVFYKRERDLAPDAAFKALFARLAVMEEAHYSLIQAELDHIKDMGFWFGIQEFTLEGELGPGTLMSRM